MSDGRCPRTPRRGYAMVLLVALLAGLMGLAALVIDLGFARLTQRQMQSATDTVALEAVRVRDHLGSEQQIRNSAFVMGGHVFDDDIDPNTGASDHVGAGPVVDFSGGIALPDTSYRASQVMAPGDPPTYRPDFSLNLGDVASGDIVRGRYIEDAEHGEASDYTRPDFTIASDEGHYLVRMRRTGETFDSDVGSAGPALPYLFGRGTMLDRDLAARGIDVRATSIATAEPASSVGVPIPEQGLPGVLSAPADGGGRYVFLVREEATQTSPLVITIDENGNLGSSGFVATSAGHVVVGQLPAPSMVIPAQLTTSLSSELANVGGVAYVPVVADATTEIPNAIIGFVMADVVVVDDDELSITFHDSEVAWTNATTTLAEPLPEEFRDGTFDVDVLFEEHFAFGATHALLAPALRRAYGP